MNKDCYFVLSILDEPIEESRYLFDFDAYKNNCRNREKFKVHKLTNKLQLWKHFLINRKKCSLYYHFFPINECVYRYLECVKNKPLSIHANDFDFNYYLEENPGVKQEFKKNRNTLFPWTHFLNNGMFELRRFAFSSGCCISPKYIRCQIEQALSHPRQIGTLSKKIMQNKPIKNVVKNMQQYGYRIKRLENVVKPTAHSLPSISEEYSVQGPSCPSLCDLNETLDVENDGVSQEITCPQPNSSILPEEIKSYFDKRLNETVDSKFNCLEAKVLKEVNTSMGGLEASILEKQGDQLSTMKTEMQLNIQRLEVNMKEEMLKQFTQSTKLEVDEEVIKEMVEDSLPCMVEKILNDSPNNQQVENEQSYLMILSQVESVIDTKLNCLLKTRLKLQNGICYFKLPGLNLNSLSGVYHRLLDRIYLSATRDIEIRVDQIIDALTISFISGEQFQPVYPSITGTIAIITSQGGVNIGLVYANGDKFYYQVDQSLLNFNQNSKIILNLQFRLNML